MRAIILNIPKSLIRSQDSANLAFIVLAHFEQINIRFILFI